MLLVCPMCKRGKDIPLDYKTDRPTRGVRCEHCTTQIT